MKKESFLIQTSLADQAREALREEIITGRLRPNERIDLAELAQRWNISPTPLRDAVKALEATGLVEIQPRRGVFVAALDREGLRETFELRIAFEGMASRLAALRMPERVAEDALARYRAAGTARLNPERELARIDELVHDLVHEHCGNRRLQRMAESVRDLVVWSRQTIIRHMPEAYLTTLPEHIAICEALAARDPDGAETAMRRHLEASMVRIDDYLDRHPSEAAV
jgi:DNA-binding GntR family transcriptional regulator